MGLEVEVGAVGDALQLAPLAAGEPEAVLDVHGALGVVRQLLRRVLEVPQVVAAHPEVDVPAGALVDPVLVPLLVGAGHDEELHLHLLELTGAEDEVARRDLVAERLADLADAERRLLARGLHDVREVDEDALRGLRTQVVQPGLVLDRAQVGLQHHVEVTRLGPLAAGAAVGARHRGELDGVGVGDAVLLGVALLQVVGAEPLVAAQALHERVGEDADVAGGDPDLTRQDHRGVEPDDVVAALDDRLPPLPLDVLLELHAQGAVVPGRPGAAVDLAGGEHEPPALAQADDVVETAGRCHGTSLPRWCRRPPRLGGRDCPD